jgi:hypothetical protein
MNPQQAQRSLQQDPTMNEMSPTEPETKAGIATAESGIVMLDGPDGVAVSMTPEAANGTGRSLIAAAETATAQLSETQSS